MSKDIELLNSFAEDFSKALGVPCKLVGESGMYSIAEMGGPNGSIKGSLTQSYDAKTLRKVCVDYLRSLTYQMDRGDRISTRYVDENSVNPPITKVAVGRWDSHQYIGSVAKGAQCVIRWLDSNEESDKYISFCNSESAEENDEDSFGVPDVDIFYFAEGGITELKVLQEKGNGEFIVLTYELAYVSNPNEAFNYEMAVTDQRSGNGQLFVDIGTLNGEVDDMLSATFEINKLPGTEISTQCMHLCFNSDAPAVSLFKKGDSYIIRPEHGVSINTIRLDDGSLGYILE